MFSKSHLSNQSLRISLKRRDIAQDSVKKQLPPQSFVPLCDLTRHSFRLLVDAAREGFLGGLVENVPYVASHPKNLTLIAAGFFGA
jgi:hypothetical protein